MTPVKEQAKDKVDGLLLSKAVRYIAQGIALDKLVCGPAQRGNSELNQLSATELANSVLLEVEIIKRLRKLGGHAPEIAARSILLSRFRAAAVVGGPPVHFRRFVLPIEINGVAIDPEIQATLFLSPASDDDQTPYPFVAFWIDPY